MQKENLMLTKLNHAILPHNRYIIAVRASNKAQRLVGNGVELRRHNRANYPLYARWYSDEEIWHLTSWAAEPMRPEAVERLFEEREKSTVEDSFAIHREGDEEPLGVVGLMNISEANASADLNVIIGDEEHRDKGLGTEAIRVI
ncbi:MAG: GNAT family N-acetyltransferase, partial [Rubrobacter sp.]|nr:GNAT family N-acetyltransferase [Rubrobacter sp.]